MFEIPLTVTTADGEVKVVNITPFVKVSYLDYFNIFRPFYLTRLLDFVYFR